MLYCGQPLSPHTMLPYFHTRITRQALAKAGFCRTAQEVIGSAAQLPDWLWWDATDSHALTPTDAHQRPLDPSVGQEQASAWFRKCIENIQTRPTSEAAAWLGCAFHLVEDLAVHQGRTGAEHSWQSLLLVPNPDWSPSGLARGRRYADQLVVALPRLIGENIYRTLHDGIRLHQLTRAEELNTFGPRVFTWRSIVSFATNVPGHLRLRPRPHVRWNTDALLAEWLKE